MNRSKVISSLIDIAGMLEHYTSGRPDNWDGSTKRQALATIREAKALIAELKEEEKVNGL